MGKIVRVLLSSIIAFAWLSGAGILFAQSFWAQSYGSTAEEEAHDIEILSNGSAVILGSSGSTNSIVLKLDSTGSIAWQKKYTLAGTNLLWSMQKTTDSGFILGGWTIPSTGGSYDFFIIKLDSAGSISWQKSIGGTANDFAYSIKQTQDGGYIIIGNTKSYGAGKDDIWVIKLNSSGNIQWQNAYGGTQGDLGRAILQTSDGGFIIAGYTASFGSGSSDILIIKVDSNGEIQWSKTYGTLKSEILSTVLEVSDGGFLIVGTTYESSTTGEIWIVKTDATGSIQWQKKYSNAYSPTIPPTDAVQETSDGGFVLTGRTTITIYSILLFKISASGSILWQKIYKSDNMDAGYSLKVLADDSIIVAGSSNSFGDGSSDFWILRLDEFGTVSVSCPYATSTSLTATNTTASSANVSVTKTTSSAIATVTSLTASTAQLTSSEQCTVPPDYDIACNPSALEIKQGASKNTSCTIYSINSFDTSVTMSCLGLPPNVTCSFSPNPVTPPANGSISSTGTITVSAGISPGYYPLLIRATSSGITKHDTILKLHILTASGLKAEYINADKNSSSDTNSNLNSIFEPGESVMIAPSWTNKGSTSINLSGTALYFNGLPGATYTIIDTLSSYGTVSVNQTVNCYSSTGNCYVLQVSNPSVRPATHWDASFQERLSTTEPKIWKIHFGSSFVDVLLGNIFYYHIESLLHSEITAGCSSTQYCPNANISRGQIAKFIAVALAGTNIPQNGTVDGQPYNCSNTSGQSIFTDVLPTYIFCSHIHYIAAEGIATKCGDTSYCPDTNLTRDQMAIFIARSIAGSDSNVPVSYTNPTDPTKHYNCSSSSPDLHFTDVFVTDDSCKHIHYLWATNIISGCTATHYCPTNTVTREQMAKFITNAFALLPYGP